MKLNLGDIVRLRKSHPCGNNEFKIMRTGMDFRIQCLKCGRQTWITRAKLERNIKEILVTDGQQNEQLRNDLN